MSVTAHLNSIYSVARLVLWVEDAVTRDYLYELWGKPLEIAFLLSGRNEAVRPMIDSARREGINHVFGLVDRDFGTSNYTNWSNPDVTVFRLPRHEIENYLLDATELANCGLNNRGRTIADIDAERDRLARLQPWWMACRRVLRQLQSAIGQDFPDHPSLVRINSLVEAESHIRSSTSWFGNLDATVRHWTIGTTLSDEIQTAHNDMQTWLANGNWIAEFSGKEIFRPLPDFLYNAAPGASPDSDLAKQIGAYQERNNTVPQELRDLRSILRQRVGLPP